ncbi:unnamed protein product [Caenorhabditis sp. 36 PRJEB53466]|nr:unnamed protein product [Caenorhabditis sp. 36 PRJEB53466]
MIFHGDEIELSTKPVHETLLERFELLDEKDPDNMAFVTAHNETDCLGFRELHRNVIVLSEWFVENGYKKGDVVLLAATNNWRFFAAALAAWRAGLVVSAASDQFTPFEMHYQIEDSQSKIVFVDAHTIPVVLEGSKGIQTIRHVVSFSPSPPTNVLSFESLASGKVKNLKMPEIDVVNDIVFLPYSSGTTGKPKGVMISHQNFAMMLASSLKVFGDIAASFGLPEDFVIPQDLHFLPMYHAMGMFRTLLNAYRGSTQILFSKFDLELMLQLIERHSVMNLAVVPAILVRMINSPLLSKYDISSVVSISVGSAPLPEGAVQKLKTILPDVRIVQGYGMTELTFASHLPGPGSPEGSVGRVVPGTSMKVLKEDGSLCKGYWRKEHLSKELIDEEGFMRTGDIVYFDKNGDTFICDRVKELIKVNAKQVAPAELESVLLEHDDVADVCVFGVEDELSGERPVACVVSKRNRDQETAKAIMQYINQKLARYKHVKEVEFVAEIMRTGTGKILRRSMKKMFLDSRKSRL